jgi:hypothetical protein
VVDPPFILTHNNHRYLEPLVRLIVFDATIAILRIQLPQIVTILYMKYIVVVENKFFRSMNM